MASKENPKVEGKRKVGRPRKVQQPVGSSSQSVAEDIGAASKASGRVKAAKSELGD